MDRSSLRVLVVSRDQMLLQTRQLILGAFFEVEGAGRIREAEKLIATRRFDLVVLCYSLAGDECQRLVELIEAQEPQPKILVLSGAGYNIVQPLSEYSWMPEAGPYYLLKRSAELLGVDLKAKGRFIAA
jgi:DNA-binding NtrC family response regulator